ncbi:TetR/AcrR family transcriptional regulator [Flammeovirga sp. SJP92]|uniref:TetR/AcrR family transcriptional regulator n=1 Tax=Flammeovirga sp. SJP92 TaxID=1775430 RepID=UPI000788B7B0|nr:TetR/AcrR family transcriptional regulator [Flammeovirga sp. SJP92]KXX69585.1 TetR family transcriptional regulator [Flammeovirga sp. SJP92]
MEQKLKSEQTQQLIIDTSFQLFYKDGFQSTSVNQIMKATSLTKGAFYHHFKDKREIGVAVINQIVFDRIHKNMILPLQQEGDAIEILKDIFTKKIRTFTDYEKEKGCPANNLINEIGSAEESYQNALRDIIDQWTSAIEAVIERERKKGTIKENTDSKAVGTFLVSAFEGVRGLRKLYHDDAILELYLVGVSTYLDQLRYSS